MGEKKGDSTLKCTDMETAPEKGKTAPCDLLRHRGHRWGSLLSAAYGALGG